MINKRRWLRCMVVWGGGSLIGGVVLLAIAACLPRQWHIPAQSDCEFSIYLASDTMHVDLVVPIQTRVFNWRQHLDLAQVAGDAQEAQYLQFGWGDRRFYMETPSWDQVDPGKALRALFFWHNQSALFVMAHRSLPPEPQERLKCLRLNQTDYLALMTYLEQAFQTDDPGQKQALGKPGFFAAQGYYSILKTCNSWTAEGLRTAGVNTPVWDGLAWAVIRQARNGCACDRR